MNNFKYSRFFVLNILSIVKDFFLLLVFNYQVIVFPSVLKLPKVGWVGGSVG